MRFRALSTGAAKLKHYKLTAQSASGSSVVSQAEGHTLRTDLPRATGGADTAAQPVIHLLHALAGCELATATYVARRMRLKIGGIRFELEAHRDERGALHLPIDAEPPVPARLLEVRGRAYVDTTEPQSKIDELAARVHVRCPVASMIVASGAVLDVDFVAEPAGSPPSDESG